MDTRPVIWDAVAEVCVARPVFAFTGRSMMALDIAAIITSSVPDEGPKNYFRQSPMSWVALGVQTCYAGSPFEDYSPTS